MIGSMSCRGCTYSGAPHNEDCPEASANKHHSVDGKAPRKYYPELSLDQNKSLVAWFSEQNRNAFVRLITDCPREFEHAQGSTYNHQAWDGGYKDHVVETLNIAHWLYVNSPRALPFKLSEALEVMFLHDLEKPFKQFPNAPTIIGSWAQLELDLHYDHMESFRVALSPKQFRREFRNQLIRKYGIQLTDAQENALRYVEGVPDSEYTPKERIMEELAAFCHCCDILSARLWHNYGQTGAW